MPKLYKYKITTAHKNHIKASGFDIHNPDKRHPVKAHDIVQLVQVNLKQPDQRTQILLKARNLAERVFGRTLGFCLLTITFFSSEETYAFNEYYTLNKEEVQTLSINIFSIPNINDPFWILFFLSALNLIALTSLIIHIIIALKLKHRILSIPDLRTISQTTKTLKKDWLEEKKEANKWYIAGATRTGKKRSENQDAFAIFQTTDCSGGFIVCDGAGGHEGGKEASQNCVKHILDKLDLNENKAIIDPIKRLKSAIQYSRRKFNDKEIKGITTAIVGVIEDDWLYYATLGDGALIVVWPDGMISNLLTQHHVFGGPSNVITAYIGHGCEIPPRVGSFHLEPDCMVMAMSDGVSDIFSYHDYAKNCEAYLKAFISRKTLLPDNLLDQVEQARDPKTNAYLHRDNLTLVMASFEKKEVSNG